MSTEMAVEAFAQNGREHIIISSAPLVEGAVIAAVEASIGNSLQEVAEAAACASTLPKLHAHDE
jgi:dihydroxyacetone kinase DhaKLM complex PTS-EIIA-like component DhaM